MTMSTVAFGYGPHRYWNAGLDRLVDRSAKTAKAKSGKGRYRLQKPKFVQQGRRGVNDDQDRYGEWESVINHC